MQLFDARASEAQALAAQVRAAGLPVFASTDLAAAVLVYESANG